MGLIGGPVLGLILSLLRIPGATGIALLTATGFVVVGISRPHALSLPFRAWNRLAVLVSNLGRTYLNRVCLYTVFPAMRWSGVSIALAPAAEKESGWVARKNIASDAYGGPGDKPAPSGALWTATYLRWVWQSNYLWAICLLPFLRLLQALEVNVLSSDLRSDTYTLY
jgi:hypothetical protein